MVKNFTQNDLVSFLYREVNFNQMQLIGESIENDWEVFQEYKNLRNAKREIPKVYFHPSPSTLNNILAISREEFGV